VVPRAFGTSRKQVQMKRKTKKAILEFLHFWPMTIVVPAMLILILFGPLILN